LGDVTQLTSLANQADDLDQQYRWIWRDADGEYRWRTGAQRPVAAGRYGTLSGWPVINA